MIYLSELSDSIHSCLKYLYGNDVKVIIHWIPSHKGIRGSDLVDALAMDVHTLDISTDTMLPVMGEITSSCKAIQNRWLLDREVELKASNLYIVRHQNLPQPLTTFLATINLVSSIL